MSNDDICFSAVFLLFLYCVEIEMKSIDKKGASIDGTVALPNLTLSTENVFSLQILALFLSLNDPRCLIIFIGQTQRADSCLLIS